MPFAAPVFMSDSNHNRRGGDPLRRFLALFLIVLMGLLAAGCGEESAEGDSASADSSVATKPKKAKKPKRASVTVAEVSRGNLVLPILAEGAIRARNQAEIRPEIAGRVTELLVSEGERVVAGQLLLRLDSREYELALREARSSILTALSTLAMEDENEAQLPEAGSLLDIEGDLDSRLAALRRGDYRAEIAAARTGVSAAEAAERRARLNLERCELRAPFAGVITGLTLSPGEWLSGGQTLFSLVDDINLEAEVQVLESDLDYLSQGRAALLTFPALGETLQVKVDIVSPTLDIDSRSCPSLMRLSNRSRRIKPGMFTRAAIAGEILTDRMLVPREAVLTRDGRPLVFKVEDELTQWIYVKLGERNEQFVEIAGVLQGGKLAPGDKVVVANHLTLTHGAQVKVKRTLHPRSPWQLDEEVQP
jgi:membrane fusion protein, multidrug efflux system